MTLVYGEGKRAAPTTRALYDDRGPLFSFFFFIYTNFQVKTERGIREFF